MGRPLNALQKGAYETIKREGSIQKGDGWTLSTARALAGRGLIDLKEYRDTAGKTYFWSACKPSPSALAATDTKKPLASGTHVVRVGRRNPQTQAVTYTQVLHVHQGEGLRGALRDLGVPDRDMVQGSGGRYTTEDGTRKIEWRGLDGGALREFVCGGQVYRVQPHPRFPGTWAVVLVDSGDIVAADPDPAEAERRAKEDAAAFNRALRS
jgi:hypothetical protein